jgi:hypothetical protein
MFACARVKKFACGCNPTIIYGRVLMNTRARALCTHAIYLRRYFDAFFMIIFDRESTFTEIVMRLFVQFFINLVLYSVVGFITFMFRCEVAARVLTACFCLDHVRARTSGRPSRAAPPYPTLTFVACVRCACVHSWCSVYSVISLFAPSAIEGFAFFVVVGVAAASVIAAFFAVVVGGVAGVTYGGALLLKNQAQQRRLEQERRGR